MLFAVVATMLISDQAVPGSICAGCDRLEDLTKRFLRLDRYAKGSEALLEEANQALAQLPKDAGGKLSTAHAERVVALLRASSPVDPGRYLIEENYPLFKASYGRIRRALGRLPRREAKMVLDDFTVVAAEQEDGNDPDAVMQARGRSRR